MLVRGPIGAMATGSGMLAEQPGDQLDGVVRHGAGCGRRQLGRPDAALAVDLGGAHDLADQRPGGPFGDRDVVPAIGVQQAERVLGAMTDVGVSADGGDGQDIKLGARDGEADGQRVVEPGIAVDDQRQRASRASRRGRSAAWLALRRRSGGSRPVPTLPGSRRSPHQPWSYGWPAAAGPRTRPTTPATTMIVTMYGTLLSNCGGTSTPRIDSSAWIASEKPNTRAAPKA